MAWNVGRTHHEQLTNFSSSVFHSFPCFSYSFLFISARYRFIDSYAANWIEPFDTPTNASNEPLYNPWIPSRVYIVRNAPASQPPLPQSSRACPVERCSSLTP